MRIAFLHATVVAALMPSIALAPSHHRLDQSRFAQRVYITSSALNDIPNQAQVNKNMAAAAVAQSTASAALSKASETLNGQLSVKLGINIGTTSKGIRLSTVPKNVPLPNGAMPIQFWPVTGATQAVYGQSVANCSTSKNNRHQEYCTNFNMIDGTGGGTQGNYSQKVGLFGSVVMIPGAGTGWAMNSDIVEQSGVGNVPFFNTEFDMTNFNKDFRVGGSVSSNLFLNFLSSFPVTAAIYGAGVELAGTYAVHDFILAQGANLVQDNFLYDGTNSTNSLTIAGSHTTGLSTALATLTYGAIFGGGQQVCLSGTTDCLSHPSGAGSLDYSTSNGVVVAVDDSGNIISGGDLYAAAADTLNLGNANHGPTLLLLDAGATVANNITIQGTSSGFPPTLAAHGIDPNVGLRFMGKGTASEMIGDVNGTGLAVQNSFGTLVNYISVSGSRAGFGPAIRAAGTDANAALNLYAKGTASVISQSPLTVVGYMKPSVLTVKTLPPCNLRISGAISSVSDATSPTFLGTLTGGGSVHSPVYCNGVYWVAG